MCTLIALWKCHPSAPLVLALNRDELLARPTAETALWNGADPRRRIVAGRDLRSGGTWFGVGRRVVAALTNHRSAVPSLPGPRSRGELVMSALESESAEAARRELSALAAEEFGPFHLIACDAERMFWITNRAGTIEAEAVAPGAHVLGNYGLDNEDDRVVANLHEALKGVGALDEAELDAFLKETLARQGDGWPCVDRGIYGTRNSAILGWGGPNPKLWVTEGPPHRTPWEDRSALLRQLANAQP